MFTLHPRQYSDCQRPVPWLPSTHTLATWALPRNREARTVGIPAGPVLAVCYASAFRYLRTLASDLPISLAIWHWFKPCAFSSLARALSSSTDGPGLLSSSCAVSSVLAASSSWLACPCSESWALF